MSEVVGRAKLLAERLLPPLGDRWLHVQAVGARAGEIAYTVPAEDRDVLVAAAWLHDVGYATELVDTGFHPLDGARFLDQTAFPSRIVALVAHHSCARIEADVRNMATCLETYPLEDSPVIDALVYADMTTGPQGQRLTYDERLAEILDRYSPDTPVHHAITRARPILNEQVRRVTARLTARPARTRRPHPRPAARGLAL